MLEVVAVAVPELKAMKTREAEVSLAIRIIGPPVGIAVEDRAEVVALTLVLPTGKNAFMSCLTGSCMRCRS